MMTSIGIPRSSRRLRARRAGEGSGAVAAGAGGTRKICAVAAVLALALAASAIGQAQQPPAGEVERHLPSAGDQPRDEALVPNTGDAAADSRLSPPAQAVADGEGASRAGAPPDDRRDERWVDPLVRFVAPAGPYLDDARSFAAGQDWMLLLLVLFNGLLALFSYRLWRSTSALHAAAREQSDDIKRSIAVAREAAEAARKSAEAAFLQAKASIGTELPRFELSQIGLVDADQSVRQALRTPSIRIDFANHGRTTAFVTQKCVEMRLARTLPPDPDYRMVETLEAVEAVEAGESVGAAADAPLGELSEAQADALLAGQDTLWVYGFLGFRDFLGMEHRMGFCLRWTPPRFNGGTGGSFIRTGPETYAYQTQDRPLVPAEPAAMPPPALRGQALGQSSREAG